MWDESGQKKGPTKRHLFQRKERYLAEGLATNAWVTLASI